MPDQETVQFQGPTIDQITVPGLKEIYDFYDIALKAVQGECRACPRALRAALRVSDDMESREVQPEDYLEAYHRKLGKPCLSEPEICNLPKNR